MKFVPVIITQNITLGIVILVITLLAFYKGRKLLYSFLISFFPAALIYSAFVGLPVLTNILPDDFFQTSFTNRLAFFSFVYLFCLYVVNRVIGFDIRRYGIHRFVDSVILATGMVSESFILIFHTLAAPDIYNFSSSAEGFLSSSIGYAVMLVVAMFSVLYSSRA